MIITDSQLRRRWILCSDLCEAFAQKLIDWATAMETYYRLLVGAIRVDSAREFISH